MSVSSGAIRPAEGTMGETVTELSGSWIVSVPRLGEELIVIHRVTDQAYNLGRVVACEFDDGTGRNFYVKTHRMRTLGRKLFVRIVEGVSSSRAWKEHA